MGEDAEPDAKRCGDVLGMACLAGICHSKNEHFEGCCWDFAHTQNNRPCVGPGFLTVRCTAGTLHAHCGTVGVCTGADGSRGLEKALLLLLMLEDATGVRKLKKAQRSAPVRAQRKYLRGGDVRVASVKASMAPSLWPLQRSVAEVTGWTDTSDVRKLQARRAHVC